jgi:hypothetical protein
MPSMNAVIVALVVDGGVTVRKFTFYGLDADRRIVASRDFEETSTERAEALVRSRAGEFELIELWEGSVLILRLYARA